MTFCSQNQHIREEASHSYAEKFLLYKSYTSKMKPLGKMFKKNYPKGSVQKEACTFASKGTPMFEEASLCRRLFSAWFTWILDSSGLCLQPPQSPGVSYVLSPPSSTPASHLPSTSATTMSNTS